jgi:hypothetical protein
MAKNKISEYSSTPGNNTDIAGINIAEGCAPSGINNAIRELMAQLKDQQTGADGDGFTVGGVFTSSGGSVFSSAVTFSSSVLMSGTNNIGNTTSSTILSGSVTQTTSSKLYLDESITTASAPPLSWGNDTNTGIYRPAENTIALATGGADRLRITNASTVIGSGDGTSTVSGIILRAPNASGSDIAGADFQITAGNGTGTGGSGDIIFKTAAAGSSGTTANTMTQRLLITKKGGFSFGSGATSYGTSGQVLKSNGDAAPSFASLSSLTDFDNSLATNGYQKLPGGLIIQWGADTNDMTEGENRTYTFPIAFPSTCATVQVTIFGNGDASGDNGPVALFSKSRTEFETESLSQATVPGITWLAIGW